MAIDTREDPGEVYPGGKVIPKRPTPSGGGSGTDEDAVHKTDFADIDPDTVSVYELARILKGESN